LAQDAERSQRWSTIEANILKLTEFAIEYPTLEKDSYCSSYPNCVGDPNGKERYENYCVYVFNTLSSVFEYCGAEKRGKADMRRKAILIEAGCVKDCQDIPGPLVDVALYKRWLLSDHGGAWEEEEIQVLNCPGPASVQAWVKAASFADYALVAFSGHGHHVKNTATNREETRVILRGGEEFSVGDLNPNNARCTLIVDACREVTTIHLLESVKAARAAYVRSAGNVRQRHRDAFDAAVQACGEGTIRLYSCSVGQIAGDTQDGGVFTFGLIDGAESWATRTSITAELPINRAFEIAKSYTLGQRPRQAPMYEGDRRLRHFPFGVVVK
ncbi:hypothetical protein HK102_009378, partial [Quaeritorhiza haematococci]